MLSRRAIGRTRLLALAGLVALIATAGCMGLGEDETGQAIDEQSAGEAATPKGNAIQPSEATQRMWEMGHQDPYLDVEATGEVHELDFYVSDFQTINPYGDRELRALTISEDPDEPGTVPGPEIRVQQGDTVRVTLHSPDSPFPGHTLHWHGIDLPWRSDGVPFVTQDIADPEEEFSYTYEFVAKQAGTYWYHCVVAFPVDLELGLFGPLIIEPKDGPELPYDREETLMFHEMDGQYFESEGWTLNDEQDPDPTQLPDNPFDAAESAKHQARADADIATAVVGGATGEYLWGQGPRDYYPEWSPRYKPTYDTFMINGKSYPDTEPIEIREGETLRLRMINAGQLHKSIHLHGHHVLVTHNDGYPLEEPRWEDTVNLAPGERKDVYVQGTNPGIWKLHDHSGSTEMGTTNANDYAFPGGQITAMVYEDFQPDEHPPPAEDATAGELAAYAQSYKQSVGR